MRNATWIRFGIATALATVGGVGLVAVGCGGDDNTVNPTPGTDSGPTTDAPVTTPDANKGDTSVPPKADAGSHAKLILVHASPDVPAIRVCFGTGKDAKGADSTVQPLPALPDTTPPGLPYPGVFPGTGGAFPDITDLQDVAITPFVVLADAIKTETGDPDAATETACDKLVGTANKACTGAKCLTADKYIALPTIPAQTFLRDNTYLLAAVGCLPSAADPKATAGRCGSNYDGGANVAVSISKLDTSFAPPDGGFGAQFVHRASAVEGFQYPTSATTTAQFAGAGVVPGFVGVVPVPQPDAGPPVDASADGAVDDGGDAAIVDAGPPPPQFQTKVFPIAQGTKFANDPPTAAVQAVIQDTQKSVFGIFIPNEAGTYVPAAPPTGNALGALPLSVIQQLTFGAPPPPSVFAPNETYTFVLLGDPAVPLQDPDSGKIDLHGVHFLAFPNHIKVKGLGQ